MGPQPNKAKPPNQSRARVKSIEAKIGNDQILAATHFDEMSRRIGWSKISLQTVPHCCQFPSALAVPHSQATFAG